MRISRAWAMPNSNTFSIPPITELLRSYFTIDSGKWIDPFSRNNPFRTAKNLITNDLSPDTEADFHIEALDFLRTFESGTIDGVMFDPPYSPRQISECYQSVGRKVHMTDTQNSFYGDRKIEVARVLKVGGYAICFGWNSGGIGRSLGFEMVEILLVAHGGNHNDTICTVEVKVRQCDNEKQVELL